MKSQLLSHLKEEYFALGFAINFLTRLKINYQQQKISGKALLYFPIVGLALGALAGGIYYFLFRFFGGLVSALLAETFLILITGALHLDGLADCCDAYFAPKSQVERKAIMKDPRNGTFGSLALILQVLLVSALLSKFSAVTGFFVILTAQVMAKVAMVNLFIFAKRTYLANANNFVSSSISMFLEKLTVVRLIINNLYLIPWFYFTPKLATAILILILFFTWAWNKFSLRQVGSLTGDAFGALHEILFSFTLFIAIVVTHLSGGHLG